MTSTRFYHSLISAEAQPEPHPSPYSASPPSSSPASSSDAVNMCRVKGKLSLCLAIVCGIALTTWQIHMPRQKRDQIDREIETAWIMGTETETETGAEKIQNRSSSIQNRPSAIPMNDEELEDSAVAFPFDGDDDITTTGAGTKHNIETYCTTMDTSFSDVHIGPDRSIPTLPFLDACLSFLQIFRNMHKMVLNRVLDDIEGNVQKLRRNYDLFPDGSGTLQRMVQLELRQGPPGGEGHEGEATILALTWLKRTFLFISRFMHYLDAGEDQTACAQKSYEETLIKYHGFATRTLFKAAFLTFSTRLAFLRDLAVDQADVTRPEYEETAMSDLRAYNQALAERLKILEEFFARYQLSD